MIVGIGTDIVEIERLGNALQRHGDRFLEHVFAPAEIEAAPRRAGRAGYFAARWAAKEAVAKALGTGIGAHCAWTDVVVHNDPCGKPFVELRGRAAERAASLGIGRIHISLSHERSIAGATAIAEEAERENAKTC